MFIRTTLTAIVISMAAAAAKSPALSEVLSALERAAEGDHGPAASLGVQLEGFNWFQHVRLDESIMPVKVPTSAVLISCNLEGQLLLYSGQSMVAREVLAEPVRVTPVFVGPCGGPAAPFGVLIESIDVRGTGIYETGFHLFVVQANRLKDVWHAPSKWSFAATERSGAEEGHGFLNVEEACPPTFLYLEEGVRDGPRIHRPLAFTLVDGHAKQLPLIP